MGQKARNNQAKVRPTPDVRNTSYILTGSLITMTVTDIISRAALVCSTERIRRRSRFFRNALRNQYVAIQKLVIFCSGYSLATNSNAFQSYLLQNTPTITIHVILFFAFSPVFSDHPITFYKQY